MCENCVTRIADFIGEAFDGNEAAEEGEKLFNSLGSELRIQLMTDVFTKVLMQDGYQLVSDVVADPETGEIAMTVGVGKPSEGRMLPIARMTEAQTRGHLLTYLELATNRATK